MSNVSRITRQDSKDNRVPTYTPGEMLVGPLSGLALLVVDNAAADPEPDYFWAISLSTGGLRNSFEVREYLKDAYRHFYRGKHVIESE